LRSCSGKQAPDRSGLLRIIVGAALLGLAVAPLQASATPATLSVAAEQHLVQQYCAVCHNYEDYAGGVEFEVFDPSKAHENAELTERMLKKLRAGMMPPAGKPRPDFDTEQALATSLENEVDAHAKPNLAMPRLHRLNRSEYQNAVRDLLGLDIDVAQLLPADDVSRGFDNQAGTLTFSPALLDAYLSAAGRISRSALGTAVATTQATYRVADDTAQNYHVDGLPFGTRGGLAVEHTFPADGTYTFKVFAVNLGNMGNFRPFGEIRGEQLLVYVDDQRIAQVDWDKALSVTRNLEEESTGQLKTIDITLPMKAGPHRIGVTYLATNLAPGLDMNHAFDRTTIETGGLPGFTFFPHIGRLRIDGPAHATVATDSPSRRRIMLCKPVAGQEERCGRQIATELARRAYRGYGTDADVNTLVQFFANGQRNGGFDTGVESMLQRLLVDPKFLFRVESAPAHVAPGAAYHVSDLDLAARLSFFLWSSIPDDELLRLANAGKLSKDDVLRGQVRRMLADPRAAALTTNFADEWLGLRALASHDPVVDQFPDFDDNLRQAFRREVELFFDSMVTEDRSVLDLLTAKYTFVNGVLAQFYGIPGVRGSYFRRIDLDDSQSARYGLLGKGALMMITAQPGRTSPVVRGNWVLRTMLGTPAPDPPADVPSLKPHPVDPAGNASPPTLRQQMEQHHSDPVCASCHKIMEPIGFALEPFDAVGHWRTMDGSRPIDAHSQLYDGTSVDGPAGVRAFLVRHQEQYLRNVTQALMTYALGRGIDYGDMPMVRSVLHAAAHDNYRFKGLIEAVVMSDLFRMNVAPGTDDKGATLHTQVTGPAGSTPAVTTASAATAGALDPGN
jgi:mono/diheme cytochrome c family protein